MPILPNLTSHCAVEPRARPEHPRLQELLRFWEEQARAANGVPSRRRFAFEDMRAWLGHLAIVVVEREPLRFKLTLVGTRLVEWDGQDGTGRYLDEVISASYRDAALARYVRVAGSGAWLADVARILAPDTTTAQLHRVLRPCADDGVRVDTILTAIYRVE